MKLGASSPPHSRLYELTNWLVTAEISAAWRRRPAMNWRPILDSWYVRALFVERVHVALEQRHVRVHAAAGLAAERLRHERRVDALLDRHLLDHGAEGHDVVGRGERVGVAQVDLVLAGAALVVAELDRDAEVFEHAHRAATEVVRRAAGDVVEVARRVDRLGAVRAELTTT